MTEGTVYALIKELERLAKSYADASAEIKDNGRRQFYKGMAEAYTDAARALLDRMAEEGV